MKKLLLIVAVIIASYSYGSAQEVGVRFGDVSGGNVAIDGIFGTGDFNRIHADVSFGNGVGIDVLWDFLYRPLGGEAFNWYAGVGPYIMIGDGNNGDDNNDGNFDLGVAGEVGLEYRFNSVPIALGVDWRPMLEIVDNTDFHAGGFGLNVRYVFGN
ncbi:MAG: hypothetical protein KAH68_07460 [Draconibacterium sp.]|nr:hypothetical protein [Draconibacterium sp.]